MTYKVEKAPQSALESQTAFEAWLQTFGADSWIFVEQYEGSDIVIFKKP